MHTIKIIAAGYLLLSTFLLLSSIWTAAKPTTALVVAAFTVTWAVISLLHLWIGVRYAGYSLSDELPILAIVFFLPTVGCIFLTGWAIRT